MSFQITTNQIHELSSFKILNCSRCYVAEDANSHQLIGYVLFFNTLDERANQVGAGDDPVAVIEDLFVSPTYRGRGIATQLFRKVLKVNRA